MKLLPSLVLTIAITPSFAQLQTIYYENGKKAIEGKWRIGSSMYQLPTMTEYAFPNDQKLDGPAFYNKYMQNRTAAFLNTVLIYDGAVTTWYRTGAKKAELTYVDGVANGPFTLYYPGGNVAEQGELVNGVNNGLWHYYTPNGKPFYTGTYHARSEAELNALLQTRINTMGKGSFLTAETERERNENQLSFFNNPNVSDTLRATASYRYPFIEPHKLSATEALRNGVFTFYYPSGAHKVEMAYADNVRTGTWTYWNEQGKVITILQYTAGNIVSVTDTNGRRYTIDNVIAKWKDTEAAREAERRKSTPVVHSNNIFRFTEVQPTFNGDMQAYLSQNLQYPPNAKADGIAGRVTVQFIVQEDGSITDAKVVRSADSELDKEALRVVRKMPPWNPGKNNGQPVKCYFTLPITFAMQ